MTDIPIIFLIFIILFVMLEAMAFSILAIDGILFILNYIEKELQGDIH